MKYLITIVLMFLIVTVTAQTVITHKTTSSNTNGHITTIDNPATNGKTEVLLFVTQKFGVYNPNEISVWYSGTKWKIINQNRKPMPINAVFNILVMPKNFSNVLEYTVKSSNGSSHMITLNSLLTNNKPNALLFVTQKYGKYNPTNVGVWYSGGKWKVYNENKQKIPVGMQFNILVLNAGKNRIGTNDFVAFSFTNNSSNYITNISSEWQLTRDATIFTTQNYKNTYNPNTTGVWYSGKWKVFNQNKRAIPRNVQFNVLALRKSLQTSVRANRRVPRTAISNKDFKINQGITVRKLSKMNVQNFLKLEIPIARITREQLNARPITTWQLEPLKQYSGSLKMELLKGIWKKDLWNIGTGIVSEHLSDFIDRNQQEFRARRSDYNSLQWSNIFPMILKFRATGGKEYRLKIKVEGFYPTNSIYIGRESIIARVNVDEHQEINYTFSQERSGEFNLYISPVIHETNGHIDGFLGTRIKKITIDRID